MRILSILSVLMFMVSSCTKEELVSVQAIQSELALLKNPEKWEFIDAVNRKSLLKSGTISLVEVFALDESTFEVTLEYAIKKFVYYKLDGNSEREEVLTMYQKFQIKNETLDLSRYEIYYLAGCDDSKWFKLDTKQAAICNVVCVFHFDNGNQFGYVGSNTDNVKLPHIAKGKWEIEVVTYDRDITRRQTTGLINFNDESILLPLLVKPDAANVTAKLVISKEKIQKVSTIKVLKVDPETGDRLWRYIPVIYNESLPGKVSFNLPFSPTLINLISESQWLEYGERDFTVIQKSGIMEYILNGEIKQDNRKPRIFCGAFHVGEKTLKNKRIYLYSRFVLY